MARRSTDSDEAIATLGGVRHLEIEVAKPETGAQKHEFPTEPLELPKYEGGARSQLARRMAMRSRRSAMARADVVVLDGEVGNSTFAETFGEAIPDRFFEMYIAEQQMVSTAVGMQVLGWRPFAATFAAFLSRAYDFTGWPAITRASVLPDRLARRRFDRRGRAVADGPRGPGVDARRFRVDRCLHPCDANQTAKLLRGFGRHPGRWTYMRTTAPRPRPVIYGRGRGTSSLAARAPSAAQ